MAYFSTICAIYLYYTHWAYHKSWMFDWSETRVKIAWMSSWWGKSIKNREIKLRFIYLYIWIYWNDCMFDISWNMATNFDT